MHYDKRIYRPPQEAFSPLLQVTSGCSYNRCAFCNMYADVPFRISPLDEVRADLEELRSCNANFERIYLVNGDPFVLSMDRLREICRLIHQYLPTVRTISMYASVRNIARKSPADLAALKALRVGDLYIGLESGSDKVLAAVDKGHTAADARRELGKLEKAGIRYHAIIMIGLGGRGAGVDTARETAGLLNQLRPRAVLCTSTIIMPNAALYARQQKGEFTEASEYERVLEMKTLIKNIKTAVLFDATHNSNSLPIKGALPGDREHLLARCRAVLENYTEEEYQQQFDRTKLVVMM